MRAVNDRLPTNDIPRIQGRLSPVRVRVVVLVYVALFVGELSWQGVAPLIPSYISTYGLTDVQGGLVLSIASLGILIASLPASYVTRHVTPRALTLTSMAVLAVAGVGMALAPGYPAIVAARFVFGLGFGILWVSVVAWLDEAAGEHSARVLAATTAVVGIGAMLGPAYAGAVAHQFGLAAPFVGLSAITLVLLALLALDRSGSGLLKEPAPPTRELLRAVGSDPDLITMLMLTVGASVVWMTADLLAPLRLGEAGFNAAQIGITFSIASLAYIGVSALTSHSAERLAKPKVAATATGLLAVCTLLPALVPGVGSTLVFLLGASIATGVMIALTFPFGLMAVGRGRVTVAVMSALCSMVWAISGIVGPALGGLSAQSAGDQVAFGLLATVCVVVTLVIARQSRAVARQLTRQ